MIEDDCIRYGGAYCISQILALYVPKLQWNNLFDYLFELVNSTNYGIFV